MSIIDWAVLISTMVAIVVYGTLQKQRAKKTLSRISKANKACPGMR
jgi:magnesium-transporting ATPase (P-type)